MTTLSKPPLTRREERKGHIHSFKRHPLVSTKRLASANPHLIGHYMCSGKFCFATYHKEMLKGKENQCPSCEKVFLLTAEDLRRARPVCPNCSNSKNAREYRAAKTLIEDLFAKTPEPTSDKPVRDYIEEKEKFEQQEERLLEEPVNRFEEEGLMLENPFKIGRD